MIENDVLYLDQKSTTENWIELEGKR